MIFRFHVSFWGSKHDLKKLELQLWSTKQELAAIEEATDEKRQRCWMVLGSVGAVGGGLM